MMRKALLPLVLASMLLAGCGPNAGSSEYSLSPEDNARFLADNGKRPDVKTLPDGLQIRIINSGHGKKVTSVADVVTVSYKGWTIDNHVFDRTDAGRFATFEVGKLIPGWTEALKMMREGDEWQIVVPADLGYGVEGAGADIPPNQTLVFNMQLLTVKHPEPNW